MAIKNVISKIYNYSYSGSTPTSRRFKFALQVYAKILSAIRGGVSYLNQLTHKMPPVLITSLKYAKAPGILVFPFTIQNLVTTVKKIIKNETSLQKRITNAIKTIPYFSSLGGSAATLSELLVLAKAVKPHIVSWIPFFGYFSLGASFISLSFSGKAVYKSFVIQSLLKKGLSQLAQAKNEEEKKKIIEHIIEEIAKKGVRTITRKLENGEEEKIQAFKIGKILKIQEETLFSKIHDIKNRPEEAEKLFDSLKKRATKMAALSLLQSINSIIAIAGTILTVFTPFLLVGQAILAVSAITSLSLWVTEYFFINPDPLNPESQSRANIIASNIKEKCHFITNSRQKYRLLTEMA